MKNGILCLAAFLSMLAPIEGDQSIGPAGQESIIKTYKEIRYQICIVEGGTVIKIDTLTGQSWHLQFASPEMKKQGIYYIWTEIPTYLAPTPKSASNGN